MSFLIRGVLEAFSKRRLTEWEPHSLLFGLQSYGEGDRKKQRRGQKGIHQ